MAIERHRAHRTGLERGQPGALPIGHQLVRVAERHAQRPGPRHRAGPHEQAVAAVLQDASGERDRVAHPDHAGDRAVAQLIALHEGRVGLHGALARQDGASPGVEARVVLEAPHRGLHRVDRGAALGEGTPARDGGVAHARAQLVATGEVGAGAAVNDESGDAACHGSRGVAMIGTRQA